MTLIDVAIVGGGAAGIAAARTLADAGRSGLLIEASATLGGRARTVHIDGIPLDLGAGWLHSADRNPLVAAAQAHGFAIDRTLPRWREQWRKLGFGDAEQEEAGSAFAALDRRMRETPPASDRAADLLEPGCRWNPWLGALSGYINGAAWSEISVADYLAYDDAATETDWRVPDGYGALIAAAAARLPLALATPVTGIDTAGRALALETPRGTISARAAIVTVSTAVLAGEALALPPAFDPVRHAAAQLPLGLADKLFLALDAGEEIDANAHLLGNPHSAVTGTYTLRPFGRPVIECFFGGDGARAVEREGLDGAAAFAIGELAGLLGSSWRTRMRLVAGSAWGREPMIGGSYSHARPGHADARRTLGAMIDERVAIAGEASSVSDFSTVHGAWTSGIAAAERVLETLVR